MQLVPDPLAAERRERLDFQILLDRLEETITSASRLPMTSRVLVDEQECLDIVDQMRMALPTEIEHARRIMSEQETLLERARTEAARIVSEAEQRASRELQDHTLVRAARAQAVEIEQQARDEADKMYHDAEEYARQVLYKLSGRIDQALRTLRTGIVEFERGRQGQDDYDDEPTARPQAPRASSPADRP